MAETSSVSRADKVVGWSFLAVMGVLLFMAGFGYHAWLVGR